MHINFAKLFPRSKNPDVTVRILRDMHLAVGGIPQHVEKGSEVTISHDTFSQLASDDYELISAGKPRLVVEDPTPARPEPQPVPAAWSKLPECFSKFFQVDQEIKCAREHVDLIRETRMRIFGVGVNFSGVDGTVLVGGMRFPSDPHNKNVISTVRPIDFDDPKNRKLDAYITKAHDAATDYLERLLETSNIPQQRRFLECGNHLIDCVEELDSVVKELAETGFQIFALRLQALGLAEAHVRKLFGGSADFLRYSNHPGGYAGGTCWGGMEEDGTMRRYCDNAVETTAGHLLRDREQLEKMKPLLKTAKAELARAQKASLPAGLPA